MGWFNFLKKDERFIDRESAVAAAETCVRCVVHRHSETRWHFIFFESINWSKTFQFSSFCDSNIRPTNNLLPKFSLWMINFCGREMAHGPVFSVPSSRCCSSCHNFRPFSQLVNFFYTCNLIIIRVRGVLVNYCKLSFSIALMLSQNRCNYLD